MALRVLFHCYATRQLYVLRGHATLGNYWLASLAAFARSSVDLFAGFAALRTLAVPVVGAVHGSVLGGGLAGYESKRSRADEKGTVSTISPYLRWGQLSPRQLHHAVRRAGLEREATKTFGRRLHWRDLAYFQLRHFPTMTHASRRNVAPTLGSL